LGGLSRNLIAVNRKFKEIELTVCYSHFQALR